MIADFRSSLLRRWLKPEVLPSAPADLIDESVPTLYVFEIGGLADRTVLRMISDQHDMPSPDKPLLVGDDYRDSRSWKNLPPVDERRWRRRKRHRQEKTFRELIDALLADHSRDVQLVPVSVYWGRAPDKEASFWQLLFSENWEIAGRARKALSSILHGRNTLLSFSEPISLREFIANETDAGDLQRKLLRLLRLHFRKRRMSSLGPDQSHRRMLIDHVMADEAVRQQIAREAESSRFSQQRIQFRAERYAFEIAANVSHPTMRALYKLLTRLWNELYEGVELAGIERIKGGMADNHELVYVPCHRSHIDYLLLSYILYSQGLSLPHIAAGINLNLPVIGGILRRGGAFFLRRSFAGNPLYAAVFSAYLKEILQRGHALEYFVEGGRSRTGLLLPPRPGMLSMTVHAYLRKPARPIAFVPVYFGYERLVEGKAFTSELAGGKKQKESIFGLLKSLRTLRENYGQVYVNFGEPLLLNDLLDQADANWRQLPVDANRPDWIRPVIEDLGDDIMRGINAAASVTPISLLATTLLATPLGRISRTEFIDQVTLYHRLLSDAHASDSLVEVPAIDPAALIEHGKRLGYIEETEDDLGSLLQTRPGQLAPLTYFRNNIQHLLCLPALIASAYSNRRSRSVEELESLVLLVLPFLKDELYLPDDFGIEALPEHLAAMASAGLLVQHGDQWKCPAGGTAEAVSLLRLAEIIMPTLKRDYLVSSIIARVPTRKIAYDDLARLSEQAAERLALTHGWRADDLYNKNLFKVFIDTLEKNGYLVRKDDHVSATIAMQRVENKARTLLGEQARHAILNAASRAILRQNNVATLTIDSSQSTPSDHD